MHLYNLLNATSTMQQYNNTIATSPSTPKPSCESDCGDGGFPRWAGALITFLSTVAVVGFLVFLFHLRCKSLDARELHRAREARARRAAFIEDFTIDEEFVDPPPAYCEPPPPYFEAPPSYETTTGSEESSSTVTAMGNGHVTQLDDDDTRAS